MHAPVTVEGLEGWIGLEVLDAGGEQLGKLDEVYFVSGTDTPAVASVRSGVLGRRRRLVPVAGASAARGHLRVAYAKAVVDDGPSSKDADLSADETRAVEAYYELALLPEGHDVLEGSAARAERERAAIDTRMRAEETARAAEQAELDAGEARRRLDAPGG